jgi:hypothetical protein
MTAPTAKTAIDSTLAAFLTETFESVQGIYLDRGTSLFETLAEISADEASIPVSDRCASIAGQTEHLRFYIEVLARYLAGEEVSGVDWDGSWWLTAVTAEEWDALRARLRAEYDRVRAMILAVPDWTARDGDPLGEAVAIVVHTAYHLGEIRQACCTVKR